MIKLGILIPRQYRLLSVAAILDVFETTNSIYQQKGLEAPFQINLYHPDAEKNGEIFHGHQTLAIADGQQPDLILIPSLNSKDFKSSLTDNRAFIPWLHPQHKRGAALASFCTGAFLLGASGLLNGRIATTHLDASRAFATAFPEVILCTEKTVTHDGSIFTSGGSTSTFHLLLYLLQIHCGKEIAVKIAKLFAIDMDRNCQSYFATFQPSLTHNDDLVTEVQQRIEKNFGDTGTIEEIIKDIPSSRRNIVRRFKQITGIPPIEYLQRTRIEAAKKLLEQTSQHINEVIMNSGYNDFKAFRRVFKKNVGMTPSGYRKKFQGQ